MRQTAFDGTGSLLDICDLASLNDLVAPKEYGAYFAQPITAVPYLTERGFAGMYIEHAALILPVLATNFQNTFANLAYGIMAYDCNTMIDRNSTFSNIAAGAYYRHRTAGVLFLDRAANGPNTFSFVGNGQTSGAPDFDNCMQGIVARSEQAAAPSMVGITFTNMTNMRTGIWLDARFAGGEFNGSGDKPPFVGVKHNTIDCNLNVPAQIENGGIFFWDYSPGVSKVDISENDVNVSYGAVSGGSVCISISGMSSVSDPGPGYVESDIHDNRATLTGAGQLGIGMGSHPDGWIRNNAGSGHGIFINSSAWAGIQLNLSCSNNLISCNEVTLDPSAAAFNGLLNVNSCSKGQFLRNTLTGPDAGAHFQFPCGNTEFRCNEMQNNTFGLVYDDYADTGNQGTTTVSNGNRWTGTFPGGGAYADVFTVMFSSSKYYVRSGYVNEIPPPLVTPLTGWFFSVPSTIVDCLSDVCPTPDPTEFTPQERITFSDTLVVEGAIVPDDAPYAQERQWRYEYDLWRKLKDHSNLAQGNSLMQSYLTGFAGSNIEALWNVQISLRNTLVPDTNLLSMVQTRLNIIQQTEAQIQLLDSLLFIVTDPDQIAVLAAQLVTLNDSLNSRVLAQEAVCAGFIEQRLAAIPELLAQLSSITPENTVETNLRRAYEIYLHTVAADRLPEANVLDELETIATQCPLAGGLGSSVAAALYQGFTGILPTPDICTDDRAEKRFQQPAALSLYPNPNQGSFTINLPPMLVGASGLLRILNAQGSVIKIVAVNGEQTVSFDLINQPDGLYFLSLLNDRNIIELLPFLIQH